MNTERVPVNTGDVEWCGDNPGIYLKTDRDGDWSALAIFFRIMLSPHGRGQTMIVLDRPDDAVGYPDAKNICMSDNEPLTDYLLTNFLSRFPAFKDRQAVIGMTRLPLDNVVSEGDMKSVYREVATSGDVVLSMEWTGLGDPMAVEVSPQHSATGEHDMYSVFLEATGAQVSVNGAPLSGDVVDRQFFGKTMSTAFLAMSETWVRPSRQ